MPFENKVLKIEYKNQTTEIAYFLNNKDSNSSIIYFHGLWAEKEDFLETAKKLEDYNIIAFDFPWHWKSTYLENLDINDLVEITHKFINHINLKNIIIIWHSMWWLIWLLYLQKYKENIKWFINIEWVLTDNDIGFTTHIANMEYSEFLKVFSDSKGMYDYAHSMIQYAKNWNLLNKYLSLDIPSLFIYWEKSIIPYISVLEQPNINIKKIINSWHHPFNENPNQFFQAISEFIDSL